MRFARLLWFCFFSTLLQAAHAAPDTTTSTPTTVVSPTNSDSAEFDLAALTALLPAGSDVALQVTRLDGTALIEHRTEQLQAPASTQKLLTALAAKLYLPDDFRFITQMEQQGDDLIIRFSGDPTLKRRDLRSMIQSIKPQLAAIKGNLLLDNSIFTGYERAVGWPWDILGVCYSAPASAMTLERNCIQGALYRNQMPGHIARASIPRHQPVLVASNARIVSASEQKRQFCDLELISNGINQYQLSGCITPAPEAMALRFAVQNTELYIGEVLRAELKRAKIPFDGDIRSGAFMRGALLVEHHSVPLPELLDYMLKSSNNLIADNLTKTLGLHYFNQPGSFSGGVAAIKAILKEQATIDLTNSVMADGSGLSRNNRLTAKQLTDVLAFIYHNEATLNLMTHIPIAGQSGTLRYRASVRTPPLKGAIQAKSGSLFGAYNLAGFLTTQSGEILQVVQLVNNYHPSEDNGRTKQPPLKPIWQFERALYERLYQLPTAP